MKKALNYVYVIEEEIQYSFLELSENNSGEKDYIIKMAYADLAALSIYHKRTDYLDFLKIYYQINNDSKDNSRFESLNAKWTAKERLHLRGGRARVNRIMILESNNLDAHVIEAILDYYEGEIEKSILHLSRLIEKLESKKVDIQHIEELNTDQYLGYLYSWLTYVNFENHNNSEVNTQINNTLAFNEPFENIIWAEHLQKSIEEHVLKCHDIRIFPLDFSETQNFIEKRELILKYRKNDRRYGKLKRRSKFEIEKNEVMVKPDPTELMKKTQECWENLMKFESESWTLAAEELNKNNIKYRKRKKYIKYKDPDKVFIQMTSRNKGVSRRNINRYTKLFLDHHANLNELVYVQSGWTSLIKNNPDILLFRTYRIKTNLAIYYLHEHKDKYFSVFNYLRIKKNTISKSKLNDLKQDFKRYPLDQINSDLAYLKKIDPNNFLYLLTKIEATIYTEQAEKALDLLNQIEKTIPSNTEIAGQNLHDYIEIYRSYLYFKLRDMRKIDQSIQILASNKAARNWLKEFRLRKTFLDTEEEIIQIALEKRRRSKSSDEGK